MKKPTPAVCETKVLTLLPCKPGVCKECSVAHSPEEPHDLNLFYQYKFHEKNGRFPTWADAMAHCSEKVKKIILKVLKSHNIEV